ncbi:MAG: hypothetical protein H0U37_07960 [Chloroflexi bacterium]|nr:hypothetical protein [Chloroflexota bacterium]
MESVIYLCEGCGDRLQPSDEVRAVYRELADVIGGEEVATPRWGYTHLGHEPQGRTYRITGRGTLSDLETQRRHPAKRQRLAHRADQLDAGGSPTVDPRNPLIGD